MNDEITIGIIREEVRRQLNILLFGTAGTNTNETEDIENPFPGMPTMQTRPVVHPYGFVSRARQGCLSVHVRGGEHPANRHVIGHRDNQRPSDLGVGEVVLYNQYGQQIRLENGKIKLGGPSSSQPVPLGNQLLSAVNQIFSVLSSHTHTNGNSGAPTGGPIQSIGQVDNGVLSKVVLTS